MNDSLFENNPTPQKHLQNGTNWRH